MKKYYYKVLDMPGMTSWLACGLAKVIYRQGEWVEAPRWLAVKGYHLLVFESLGSARRYVGRSMPCIYRCVVEGVITPLPQMLTLRILRQGVFDFAPYNWPEGTVMVRRVKLLNMIQTKN